MNVDEDTLRRMVDAYVGTADGSLESMRAAVKLLPEPLDIADQVAMTVVSELEQRQALTEEDMRLIREHVRPKDSGDAVEAAVLKERVRCAQLCNRLVGSCDALNAILAGSEPEMPA